jgi:hypothetical protein
LTSSAFNSIHFTSIRSLQCPVCSIPVPSTVQLNPLINTLHLSLHTLHNTALYCNELCCNEPIYDIACTVLYCTVLHCTVRACEYTASNQWCSVSLLAVTAFSRSPVTMQAIPKQYPPMTLSTSQFVHHTCYTIYSQISLSVHICTYCACAACL